ncbi:MAG: hypothetical protein B6242_09575 [Anaerolineaceae bacterium 4572_78]|nr:MAG: hypothetical protein B6242_09575 [Anaerolineaceae bacterium 4572_78]
MEDILGQVEFDTSNPEPRCPCVLALDVSGSMYGDPITQLNDGLVAFEDALKDDDLASMRVEVAIVAFSSTATVQLDFVTANQFESPKLKAGGTTAMGEAIDMSLDMVRRRKGIYKQNGVPYYRPWIFLITDGTPTDEWQAAAQRVRHEESSKSVAFFAVGVQGADLDVLSKISSRQPVTLKGLNFREMFVWLSASLTSVSHSQIGEQVPLQSPVGWAEV